MFQWISLATPRIPQLALAFHPANGGKRDPREAARLKGLGVRPGVPDVMICASNFEPANPRYRMGYFHGLAIELKSPKGRLTPEQDAWRMRLQEAGWSWHEARSFDEARAIIADYFGVKP